MTAVAERAVQYLTPVDLAQMWQVSLSTLANWRSTGRGPAFSRFGGLVRYHPDDVAAWAEDQQAR